MQKPMNAQLSTTLGLGLLVISTVGTPGLEPSSKYFEIEFVNLWWNRLVGFRLKPKFGSVSGDCCSVINFLTSHVMAYFVPHAWYRNPWLLNGLRWDTFQCRAEWGGFDILSSHLPCVQPVVSASIEVQTGEGIPTPVYFKVVSSCILLDFCGLCALGYLIECIYI